MDGVDVAEQDLRKMEMDGRVGEQDVAELDVNERGVRRQVVNELDG